MPPDDSTLQATEQRHRTWPRALLVLGLLYLFLVGVSTIEGGINALGAETQAKLFQNVTNPLAGLFVGILGTVLVQSSSVSTSTIVGLVATGVLPVDTAVPMVMGANIGTTVTNTLASLGHVRRTEEFRRAFAAATVHDMFNVLAVAVLLPLELATGFLASTASWLADLIAGSRGAKFDSPINQAVKEPVGWIEDILASLGLHGNVLGAVTVLVGLALIFVALFFIARNMRELVAERVERSFNRLLGHSSGIIAMTLGLVVTMTVQSSSITTSILIPLAASGILTLENAYPVTLGANVGTTITALLAALATDSPEALTIALVHTLFNVSAIILFYPVPFLREIPMRLARGLANLAVTNRVAVVAYVGGLFLVVPLVGILILK